MSSFQNINIALVDAQSDFGSLELLNEDGLIGISQELTTDIIEQAYLGGAFPWYKFLKAYWWFSPDPRMVLYPGDLKVSKSMRQFMRHSEYELTANRAFEAVVKKCAEVPRRNQEGTWITRDYLEVYTNMHMLGKAHSIEVWKGTDLVGGLYGVALGSVFFGESMFSSENNASKRAFIALARAELLPSFHLIDCQVYSPHLERLGARLLQRQEFLKEIKAWT